MNEQLQLQNIQLLPLAVSLREVKSYFDHIFFTHFCEHNSLSDALSKEGLLFLVGQVVTEEVLDGHVTVYIWDLNF